MARSSEGRPGDGGGVRSAHRRSVDAKVDAVFDWLPDEGPVRHDGERLQKVLASLGWGSRRACEVLIEHRRVRVNGEIAVLGRRVDPDHDTITVDGAPAGRRAAFVHYLLNKPARVVTTASDPQGRRTVIDLVPGEPRVFPVGRLDFDTEGLIVLTNEGELAHLLAHPSFGVEKEYVAEVRGSVAASEIARLRNGVELDDGPTAPAKVRQLGPSVLQITIHEGRNRQIRRMCDAVGHPVERLVRTRFGPLRDQRLAPGAWRTLADSEVMALREAVMER